ncbi:2-keto-gluconate dehydrogenase subunit [Flammeovirgaceae bacterium 311]|nr:2-keto-gluconate dehydrogenase subunit [Flammeovirgaceae bacterium 311]
MQSKYCNHHFYIQKTELVKYNSYDLVVIGTGFASTFFLKKYLSKAPASAKVLVLERGYLYPHAERVKEQRGEQTPYAKLNIPYEDAIINETPEKHWKFQSAFGGSSNCWFGCTPRFLPSDFKMKSLYGIASDWPLDYDDLESYYTEVEEAMSISGPSDETPFPRKGPYPQPPHEFTAVDKVLKQKWGKLYINQPTARARMQVKGRAGICCGSAICQLCPVDAKFTIENSGIGVFRDSRVELLTGAAVHQLDLQQNRVRAVHYEKDGSDHQVNGEVVALGTNAIFNANILLNSGDLNPFTGKGLGEQFGLQTLVYLDNMENVGGSTWVNANGYMLYDGEHRKEYAACMMESGNYPYFRLERGKWRNIISFRMIFEDLPQERNYVATTRDVLKPAVHFAGISDYTSKAVEKMKVNLPKVLSCLPVEKIEYLAPYDTEAHIMGTARMSKTASEGVVDKHLIHHQYRNLFVLGASSFTTFTPSNPTLTLSALSLHAADQAF